MSSKPTSIPAADTATANNTATTTGNNSSCGGGNAAALPPPPLPPPAANAAADSASCSPPSASSAGGSKHRRHGEKKHGVNHLGTGDKKAVSLKDSELQRNLFGSNFAILGTSSEDFGNEANRISDQIESVGKAVSLLTVELKRLKEEVSKEHSLFRNVDVPEIYIVQTSRKKNAALLERLEFALINAQEALAGFSKPYREIAESLLGKVKFSDQTDVAVDDETASDEALKEARKIKTKQCLDYFRMQSNATLNLEVFLQDTVDSLQPIIDDLHMAHTENSWCLEVLDNSDIIEKMNEPAQRQLVDEDDHLRQMYQLDPFSPFNRLKQAQERMKARIALLQELREYAESKNNSLSPKMFYPSAAVSDISAFFGGVGELARQHNRLCDELNKVKNPELKDIVASADTLASFARILVVHYSSYARSFGLLKEVFCFTEERKKSDLDAFLNGFVAFHQKKVMDTSKPPSGSFDTYLSCLLVNDSEVSPDIKVRPLKEMMAELLKRPITDLSCMHNCLRLVSMQIQPSSKDWLAVEKSLDTIKFFTSQISSDVDGMAKVAVLARKLNSPSIVRPFRTFVDSRDGYAVTVDDIVLPAPKEDEFIVHKCADDVTPASLKGAAELYLLSDILVIVRHSGRTAKNWITIELPYIVMKSVSHDGISITAGDCSVTLRGCPPCLSGVLNDAVDKAASKRVFCRDLATTVKMNENGSGVALLCDMVLDLFEQGNGECLDTEGIFRVCSLKQELDYTVELFNAGLPVQLTNPIIAAALLKRYLINLPTPLISKELYDSLSSACKEPESKVASSLSNVINSIHDLNVKNLLAYIMHICDLVLQHSSANLMGEEAIATCFTPCIIKCEVNPKISITVVRALICHRNELFKTGINVLLNSRVKAKAAFRKKKRSRLSTLQRYAIRRASSTDSVSKESSSSSSSSSSLVVTPGNSITSSPVSPSGTTTTTSTTTTTTTTTAESK